MPQLTITCSDPRVLKTAYTFLLGLNGSQGYEDGETTLQEILENSGEVPNGIAISVIGVDPNTILIDLKDVGQGLEMLNPRLSKEEALKLKPATMYSAICRLRGPKWNSDGKMAFAVEQCDKSWSPIEFSIVSEEWAQGMSSIYDDGEISNGDGWHMEILSRPIELGPYNWRLGSEANLINVGYETD